MTSRCFARLCVTLLVGAVATAGWLPFAGAARRPDRVPVPTVTGPVTGGSGRPTLLTTTFDLADVGYTREEYFLEGTATAYTSAEPLTPDGIWNVAPQATAPYTTRIVVHRPSKAKDFDGTVFVEWFNVSPGFDNAPDWGSGHNAIIRDGAAWIGVSAQSVGVQGRQSPLGGESGGLVAGDPERYGSLTHPGDSYSYDIFSQAGVVAGNRTSPAVLGKLKVKRVIAIGESQSAHRLITYVNAVQPIAEVYDGFLVHSVVSRPASLSASPLAAIQPPTPTLIRDDLDVPVFMLQTETDVMRAAYGMRRPDTKRFRIWEIAGTSHADFYQGGPGFGDTGSGDVEKTMLDMASVGGGPLNCAEPINYGPQYAVLNAALHHLNNWVTDGTAPPRAQPLDVAPGPPVTINRDAYGNALGGVRTPLVDVPIARLDGEANAGGSFCSLYGHTVPFDAATIAALYPTPKDYVRAFTRANNAAVKAGFLLPEEAKNLKAAASSSATSPTSPTTRFGVSNG